MRPGGFRNKSPRLIFLFSSYVIFLLKLRFSVPFSLSYLAFLSKEFLYVCIWQFSDMLVKVEAIRFALDCSSSYLVVGIG